MQNVQKNQPGGNPEPDSSAADPNLPAPVSPEWHRWFDKVRARVDSEISAHLNRLKRQLQPHSHLLDAVEYSLVAGGKRLRPVLVLESCRVCGGTEEQAWPAALAIECIHTFSLIHDDLPAMDDDDLRRGKPTSHKVFGEAAAILAGGWLEAHAFDLLGDERFDEHVSADLVRTLAQGTADMIVGQGADMAGQEHRPDAELVRFIHRHKTARLLETACRLGAVCGRASADELNSMGEYGEHLGLAFQIADDLLDLTGATARLGKRAGKDAGESKQTYPAAYGVDESRRQAHQEVRSAVAALEPLGERANRLRELAWYVVARDR
jgi:geranylgeranyl diphosphate synthase type II